MLKTIIVGLGPIGAACARAVDATRDMRLVGLVDVDPEKVGKPLSRIDDTSTSEVIVADDIGSATREGADVAVVCTSSWFDQVAPTVETCVSRGLCVVSSCEQMLWPWYAHAALAQRVDDAARRAGKAVIGSGVNPGFVMDALAVVLSSMVCEITAVRCVRRVDAGTRREPLQAKVGATLTVDEFRARVAQNKLGHMGSPESVALLAAGLGRDVMPGSVDVTIDPVVADVPMVSALGTIAPGHATGIHQVACWRDDVKRLSIELDLTMAVGTSDPCDRVELQGPTPLTLELPGGVPGDTATVAAMVNLARVVHDAQAGLRTMLDVRPAGARHW